MDLNGKTIVVSGAAGAIGFDACRMAAAAGAGVVCIDRAALSAAQGDILAGLTDKVLHVACDVTDGAAVADAVDQAVQHFGTIDGLVNSAGIDRQHDFFDLTYEEFSHILNVNVLGSFRISQAVARHMRQAPRPAPASYSIVHLSSVNAVIGTAHHTAYATTKGAIAQMTRVMAVALAPYGIRVNAVGPGTVRGEMLDDLVRYNPQALDKIMQRTPMARLAEVNEVSDAIGFLLSDRSSFVTGQTLYVDGGRTVQNLTL